jgi:hypothetical protein
LLAGCGGLFALNKRRMDLVAALAMSSPWCWCRCCFRFDAHGCGSSGSLLLSKGGMAAVRHSR